MPDEILKVEQKINKIKKEKDIEISNQKFENAAKLRDKEKVLISKLEIEQSEFTNKNEDYLIVTEKDLADTLSVITGIPLYKITQNTKP